MTLTTEGDDHHLALLKNNWGAGYRVCRLAAQRADSGAISGFRPAAPGEPWESAADFKARQQARQSGDDADAKPPAKGKGRAPAKPRTTRYTDEELS